MTATLGTAKGSDRYTIISSDGHAGADVKTYKAYLETKSVVATGVIGGAFSLSTAVLAPAFGTYVDHHRKKAAMVLSTVLAVACFAVATAIFVSVDADTLLALDSPWFWALVAVSLLGSVSGQMRNIAMSTTVTLLVPDPVRDRANGMVGSVTGLSFAITSARSIRKASSSESSIATCVSGLQSPLAATSVSPMPRKSGAMQRRRGDRRSIAPRHWKPLSGKPCRNSAASPRPRSR